MSDKSKGMNEENAEPRKTEPCCAPENGISKGDADIGADRVPVHSTDSDTGENVVFQKLKRDMDSLKSSLVCLQADFDNYRKRIGRERSAWTKYAIEPVLPGLLEVVDDMERAISAGCGSVQEGMQAVLRKMLTTLERSGVMPFVSQGEPFDPHYHDAVAVVHEGVEREVVKEVLLKGYNIHDKVARHARVVVSAPLETRCCGEEGLQVDFGEERSDGSEERSVDSEERREKPRDE